MVRAECRSRLRSRAGAIRTDLKPSPAVRLRRNGLRTSKSPRPARLSEIHHTHWRSGRSLSHGDSGDRGRRRLGGIPLKHSVLIDEPQELRELGKRSRRLIPDPRQGSKELPLELRDREILRRLQGIDVFACPRPWAKRIRGMIVFPTSRRNVVQDRQLSGRVELHRKGATGHRPAAVDAAMRRSEGLLRVRRLFNEEATHRRAGMDSTRFVAQTEDERRSRFIVEVKVGSESARDLSCGIGPSTRKIIEANADPPFDSKNIGSCDRHGE